MPANLLHELWRARVKRLLGNELVDLDSGRVDPASITFGRVLKARAVPAIIRDIWLRSLIIKLYGAKTPAAASGDCQRSAMDEHSGARGSLRCSLRIRCLNGRRSSDAK